MAPRIKSKWRHPLPPVPLPKNPPPPPPKDSYWKDLLKKETKRPIMIRGPK